jgi:DNA-nicking Smr family endonuclease
MSGKKKISEEDLALFREAMADVRQQDESRPAPYRPKLPPKRLHLSHGE